MQTLNFKAKLLQNGTMNAAYIEVPYDIKALFGKGRLLVNATFDGVAYQGQVVKMGTPCYIIGVPQNIRKQIGKSFGEEVQVTLAERQKEEPEFRTIAEYIEAQEESHQNDLRLIYHWLKETLGDAEEKIAWGMPTFWKKRNLCHFAANKKHIGLYPDAEAIQYFSEDLKAYKSSKGAIQFPYGQLDEALIVKIASFCYEKALEEEGKK